MKLVPFHRVQNLAARLVAGVSSCEHHFSALSTALAADGIWRITIFWALGRDNNCGPIYNVKKKILSI